MHLDHLNLTDIVKQFDGVIGRNGQLVHDGDFVIVNTPLPGLYGIYCTNALSRQPR